MGSWARQELVGADLPDPRYIESLSRVAERLAEGGEMSFSQAAGHAGRQAARRAFGCEGTTPEGLLQGHFEQTGARCAAHALVLAVQDTTYLDYTTHTAVEGLGPLDNKGRTRGMLAHSVLAVSPDGQPLGLLDLSLWSRDPASFGIHHQRRKRAAEDKESHKWTRGLRRAQQRVPSGTTVLMVQDREADVFAFLAEPRNANVEILVRAAHPRNALVPGPDGDERTDVGSAASAAPVVGSVVVQVKRQANREERSAVLTLRSTCATVLPPRDGRVGARAPQAVFLVDALEEEPPDGEEPLHWVLLTTMAVADGEDAARLLRWYALRWTVERLHYVLKSGCRVERLQIDHIHRLRNAVALHFLVAWRILHLTHLARTRPDAPAAEVLRSDEIEVLGAAAGRSVRTVAEAVQAIAVLGGHQRCRNAPMPGPKRLWLGLRRLEAMTAGWHLAKAASHEHCETR